MEKKHFETLNVVSFFLLILFFITKKQSLLFAGFGLIGVSIFIKPLGRLIAIAWLKLSLFIGTFNSKVILTIVFFIFLTPLAFLRKLTKHNLLHLRKLNTGTYWKRVDKEFRKNSLEKTW